MSETQQTQFISNLTEHIFSLSIKSPSSVTGNLRISFLVFHLTHEKIFKYCLFRGVESYYANEENDDFALECVRFLQHVSQFMAMR